jgi:hypothetical protein
MDMVTYTLGIYVPWKNWTITNRTEKLGFEQPAHASRNLKDQSGGEFGDPKQFKS